VDEIEIPIYDIPVQRTWTTPNLSTYQSEHTVIHQPLDLPPSGVIVSLVQDTQLHLW